MEINKPFYSIISILVMFSIMSFTPKNKDLNILEVRLKTGDDSYKTYKVENNSLNDNSIIKVRAGIWDKRDKVFRVMLITKENVEFNFCYEFIPFKIINGKIIKSNNPEIIGKINHPSEKASKFIDNDGYFEISPDNYKNSSRYILEIYRCGKKSKGSLTMKFLIDQ